MFLSKRLLRLAAPARLTLALCVFCEFLRLGTTIVHVTVISAAIGLIFDTAVPTGSSASPGAFVYTDGTGLPLIRWGVLFACLAAAAFLLSLFEQMLSARISNSVKVTFRNALFEELSFGLSEGETAAPAGASGSGKTTIAYLLARFYEPDRGRIFLDGRDILSISKETFRDSIAIVSGNSHIFDGTIRDHLMIGDPDDNDEKMTEVLGMAGLGDFIEALPGGLDRYVGEQGGKLSGGQKQRLAIARALLQGAELFGFDEATSNVDTENEQLIRETVRHITSIRTSLIISSRLEMVRTTDRIFTEQAAYQAGKVLTWGN